jgi:hypothetical protein
LHRSKLNKDWHFKQESSLNDETASSWLPVAQFPTVARIDLLHYKLIPDPYIDTNELKYLWVNDANWTYCTMEVGPVKFSKTERVEGEAVFLAANCPAKGIVVSMPIGEGDDAVFDDNFIDLVLGEEIRVSVKGLNG